MALLEASVSLVVPGIIVVVLQVFLEALKASRNTFSDAFLGSNLKNSNVGEKMAGTFTGMEDTGCSSVSTNAFGLSIFTDDDGRPRKDDIAVIAYTPSELRNCWGQFVVMIEIISAIKPETQATVEFSKIQKVIQVQWKLPKQKDLYV